MKKFKVPNIVFSSSCTVYGQPEKLPVTENTTFQPAESPYGNTKQICEEILRDSSKAYPEIKSIALRYFNPVGAHPSGIIGEQPFGVPGNLIPYLTQVVAGLRPQLTVFGNDYPTPDGSCIRDYIHICDLADAHIAALTRSINDLATSHFETFNIGTGIGLSVLEIIEAFEKATGLSVPYTIGPRRAGDVVQVWADTKKSEKVLGWKASHTAQDMMRDAWNWQKKVIT